MTCRDCKNYKCRHPIYGEDAEICVDYIPKRRDRCVRLGSHVICQTGYNLHIHIIYDDGKTEPSLMCCMSCTKPLSRLALYKQLKIFIKEKGGLNDGSGI